MEPTRPPALTVMAVLNIVVGSLGLVCYCFSTIGMVILANPAEFRDHPMVQELIVRNELLAQEVPSYAPVQFAGTAVNLLLSILLIVAGIGLLYVQSWARICSLVYSALKIIMELALLGYTIAIVSPALARIQPGMAAADQALGNAVAVAVAFFYVIHAVALLVVLLHPSVSAAFGPNGGRYPSPHLPDDFDDLNYPRPSSEEL